MVVPKMEKGSPYKASCAGGVVEGRSENLVRAQTLNGNFFQPSHSRSCGRMSTSLPKIPNRSVRMESNFLFPPSRVCAIASLARYITADVIIFVGMGRLSSATRYELPP